MTHLPHLVENVLVPSASGAALRGKSFPHAAEAMGVDHAELLIDVIYGVENINDRPSQPQHLELRYAYALHRLQSSIAFYVREYTFLGFVRICSCPTMEI